MTIEKLAKLVGEFGRVLDLSDANFALNINPDLRRLHAHLKSVLPELEKEQAAVSTDLEQARAEFAILSRACGNWREWPEEMVSTSLPDYTHSDWEAAARAIIERNQLREGKPVRNEHVAEPFRGILNSVTSPADASRMRERELAEARRAAIEESRLAYESHYMDGRGEDKDTCQRCELNFRNLVHLRNGETTESRIAALAAKGEGSAT